MQGDAFNANTPERNGWVTRGLQAVPEILKKQFAGMEYGAEKLAAQTDRGGYDPVFGEVDLSARPANNAPLSVYKEADKRIQELRPKADEGAVAQYGFDIASNVGAQIPNLIAGGALGEGLALTAMGAMSGADKYVDLSESGVSGPKAALGAGIVGTGEALTELLPMKALLNKTLPLVKRLVLHAGADVPGEVVQMINENAVDWWMKTPNASVSELTQKIKDDIIPTVITSFGSALVLGSGAHATHRIMQERARGKSADPHQPVAESQGVQATDAAPALTRETMRSVMPETQEEADELIKLYGEGKESTPIQQEQSTDPHQPRTRHGCTGTGHRFDAGTDTAG